MASKPTVANARWATDGGAEITGPSGGQRDSGFVHSTRPPADYFNYLLNQAYLWFLYLSDGELSGNHVIGGTLNVTGAVDFDSTLNVDNTITVRNSVKFMEDSGSEGVIVQAPATMGANATTTLPGANTTFPAANPSGLSNVQIDSAGAISYDQGYEILQPTIPFASHASWTILDAGHGSWETSTNAAFINFPLTGLVPGQKITAVYMSVDDGASSTMTISLYRIANGVATQIGSSAVSAGSGADQVITITPGGGGHTILDLNHYMLQCITSGGGANQRKIYNWSVSVVYG